MKDMRRRLCRGAKWTCGLEGCIVFGQKRIGREPINQPLGSESEHRERKYGTACTKKSPIVELEGVRLELVLGQEVLAEVLASVVISK